MGTTTDATKGLSTVEVEARKAAGKINVFKDKMTKSYTRIIARHLLTFFNLVNLILFLLVLVVGSSKNGLFVGVVAANAAIGLYQEIKAKRLLDKLTLLTATQAKVIRNGELLKLPLEALVVDDVLLLETGDQIPCDAQVLKGSLDVNEALLTGEPDSISKEVGASLFSGSFVTSGKARCQICHVGADNYIHQLTKETKSSPQQTHMLGDNLDRVIRIVSFVMLPLCVLLFLKQLYLGHLSIQSSVLSTVAAAVGMFPQGLVLLTSMALTLGVIRLAKQKVLVQELHTVDSLARVDVLCLDKTGTITAGEMKLERAEILTVAGIEPLDEAQLSGILGNILSNLTDNNATSLALRAAYPEQSQLTATGSLPFSSERKYSAVSFKGRGSYYLGALQFLFPENKHSELTEKVASYAAEGLRVLVLAQSQTPTDFSQKQSKLSEDLRPLALLLLSDVIREDARETLTYFRAQGVTCKIISGDAPETVAAIAHRVGLTDADKWVNATTLTTDEALADAVERYTVFGRVTPRQKRAMVAALKAHGHTVAMTGDGVNDVLAFKEADCSIAMSAGSDAAKQTANLVLLDNNFSAMPHIVGEGRRVINNLSRSGALLMVKVIFSVLITLFTLAAGYVYPFEPIQLTVIIACFVAIPSFLLSFEDDFARVSGNFLQTLFKRAFPTAFTIALGTALIANIGYLTGVARADLAVMSLIFTAGNYVLVQRRLYYPANPYRNLIFYGMLLLYVAALLMGHDFLSLGGISYNSLIVLLAALAFLPLFHSLSGRVYILAERCWIWTGKKFSFTKAKKAKRAENH